MSEVEMIPCDQVIIKLWDYLDGELGSETSAAMEAHLDACARCFPEFDFQRAYKEFVRETRFGSVPPELRRSVFETILNDDAEAAGAGGLGSRLARRVRGWIGRGDE